MVSQHGIRRQQGRPPIRYDALETCLRSVGEFAQAKQADIHVPRIGCGLAGGTWEEIEPIIQRVLCAAGVEVFVYDFAR